jgi:glutamate 5-kinase
MSDGRRVVVKIGSSSVTDVDGAPATALLERLAAEIAGLGATGTEVIVVSSGAVAAGWAAIGKGAPRPDELAVLQAVSAVGQHHLMSAWSSAFAAAGCIVGQVLLAPHDFADRNQYLHARQTLEQLLALKVVPVVNENDAVADDEIRFGDNDRLAALVAHLVGASRLVMLTDAPGLLSANPALDPNASLIEEVTEFDRSLEERAGGPGTAVGSGGMASKLAAARIATWSGIEAVIASASAPGVLSALEGGEAVGTRFVAREARLPARKLWIAFALGASGRLVVDEGAQRALMSGGSSLLAHGVISQTGEFEAEDAVEVVNESGVLIAKGLVRFGAKEQAPEGDPVLIHRDDLVLMD